MNGKRWIALGIAALLLLVSVSFQFVSTIATGNFEGMFEAGDEPWEEHIVEDGSELGRIAVIDLEGVIQDTGTDQGLFSGGYNHREFLYMLERAGENNDIEGIIINVNTPGGGVVESAEIHDRIVEIQEEQGKPVYVTMGNQAASGGYYVAAPADRIIAHPATITGSIGVIMQNINITELADDLGVDFTTIQSGPYKDIMSATREMTDDEEEILQSIIDEFYDDFVTVIDNGRDNLTEQEVRELGDGRIYSGTQAHEVGLVDDLGTLANAIDIMKEEYGLEGSQVVRFEPTFRFNQFLGVTARNLVVSDMELLGINKLLTEPNAPRAMYLYTE
ncbi:signal peptide peptidase SppA [Bacillus sp. FJAT-44742]|uniref:signal peptide peptidase SppA n=1 Tax=Bacillus sp. FJAT-44742 TaxID=2014005 RepID=UPI000C23F730|nr:signal peptide peptidase SppA [Bacillus sp. FJAT-44742]